MRNEKTREWREIEIKVDGGMVSITACSSGVFRIRATADGAPFRESLLERYGALKTDWPEIACEHKVEDGREELRTARVSVTLDRRHGHLSVTGADGASIIERIRLFPSRADGELPGLASSLRDLFCLPAGPREIIGDSQEAKKSPNTAPVAAEREHAVAEFSYSRGSRFYGGGSASRSRFEHSGSALQFWATYQKSEAPMPLLVCSDGWGVFHNTTTRNYMDVGRFRPDKLYLVDTAPDLDFYLIVAADMAGVIDAYTELSGRPYLLPRWAYGLAFGSNILENQFNVLDNALRFRQEQIPCDLYWLEPQWMETNYDYSTQKKWNENRFQANFHWLPDLHDPKRSNLFVNRMKDLGFKTALWLCANHDLSIEEEDHLAAGKGQPQSDKEHWFDHLRKFIDHGVAGFKLDPGRTINEHPDRQYHNGRPDAEMHNLNQVLLLKQMCQTFRNHTGRRGFNHYCGGYAGSQHWGALTVGDNGGGPKTLFDILNHAFCGNTNMAIDALEDVAVKGPAIHYTFFTPWVQLNSWAWMLHPWYYNDRDKEMFRFYAQLRYCLIPYIYSAAIEASRTGMPIVRPMVLAYPNDRNLDECVNQFMFGDSLLVGAFTSTVYLPEGNWIDYWTGIKYAGKQTLKCNIPDDRGGPMLIKSGAIIPCQKPVPHIGDQPAETIILKVYPEKQSSYTLLEDDGISFNYESGAVAATRFDCHSEGNQVELIIHPTRGTYSGMPERQTYEVHLASPAQPQLVTVNNIGISDWSYSNHGMLVLRLAHHVGETSTILVK